MIYNIYKCESELPDNTIAIDGVVYLLDDWEHPGGNQIRLFGGNDVSVQYRMIHAFHGEETRKVMPVVGKLLNYNKDYTFNSEFEKELKEEVKKVVLPHKMYATSGFRYRVLLYCLNYVILMYYYVIYGANFKLCTLLGIAEALIGLNVQHDANHGAISRKPFWNDILGYGADLIGGNKYLWLQQHWTHHAFTNDNIRDPDAKSMEPFLIFHNYNDESPNRKYITKFQYIYMIPLFSLYWLSSIFSSEIFSGLQFSVNKYSEINFKNSYIQSKIGISIILRLVYLYLKCFSQFYHYDTTTAMIYIIYSSFVSSLTLAIPFSLSHNFENVERFPSKIDWYKSQVETSCTYGGKYIGYLCGGLNYQIEHHLFPRMSSAWYPYIQDTVMKVCKKHKIRYTYYPTFLENFKSTINYVSSISNKKKST